MLRENHQSLQPRCQNYRTMGLERSLHGPHWQGVKAPGSHNGGSGEAIPTWASGLWSYCSASRAARLSCYFPAQVADFQVSLLICLMIVKVPSEDAMKWDGEGEMWTDPWGIIHNLLLLVTPREEKQIGAPDIIKRINKRDQTIICKKRNRW